MRGARMDKIIDSNFSTLMLAEMLLDEKLINKPTFEAIKNKLMSENRTINNINEIK